MKQIVTKITVGLILVGVSGVFAGNPILKKSEPGFLYAADPAAEVFDGKVYVYCSRDVAGATTFKTMQDYMVLESSDLKTWINHGVVLEPRTDEGFDYAHGQMNAPDVAYKDGWYYYYFPYNKTHVGVAKSKTPIGPWETAVADKVTTIFDPTVFVDDDGQAYIYGNDTKVNIGDKGRHVMGAKLKDNMVELDGPWIRLSEEQVNEAVHVFKRDGKYYFHGRVGSETKYWMADEPLPRQYAKMMGVLAPDAPKAPNHASAIEFEGEWYFFYHRGDVNNGSFFQRSSCFDKMHFNEDGTIQPIVYTIDEGANDQPEAPGDAGINKLEAETFFAQSGITVEGCSDVGGGKQVGFINDGDWISFAGVDFGNKSEASILVKVRAACKHRGGTIELRFGSETSKIVGSVAFKSTGGWDKYETFEGVISKASGTHDLYLTFRGADKNLLNLNWIDWTPVSNAK